MSVRAPSQNADDKNACRDALRFHFKTLIQDAKWSGWEGEAIANALSELAKEHLGKPTFQEK